VIRNALQKFKNIPEVVIQVNIQNIYVGLNTIINNCLR